MDICDIASDRQQLINDAALSHRKPVRRLLPNGECQNPLCGLELENPKALFCGPGCSREFEQEVSRGRVG